MLSRHVLLGLSLLLCSLWTSSLHAADFRTKYVRTVKVGVHSLICKKVSTPPIIDGEVDKDPVWQQCRSSDSAFVQLGTEIPSKQQTMVYTCYDDTNINIGFVCEEKNLGQLKMDGPLGNADSVEAVFEISGLLGEGDTYSFRANELSKNATLGFPRIPDRDIKPWRRP